MTQVSSGLDEPRGIAFLPAHGGKVDSLANPGVVDVPVRAVSVRGAIVLVLLVSCAGTVAL